MRRALACALLVVTGCSAGNGLVRIVGRNVRSFLGTPAPVVPYRPASFAAGQTAVTWVGHATTLIQIEDRFLLTDPVFTETVGSVSRRIVRPGLPVADVPYVDAVLISHQHFDHLSFGSLDLLRGHFQNLLVPAGTSALLPQQGLVVWEIPWGARYHDGDLEILAVPVKHVSGRYGMDQLWRKQGYQGYLVEYRGKTIFYAGDTAYAPGLAATVRALAKGPIDIALLPIAPIHPRSLMQRTHADPDEAMQLFAELGARHMVAIHYDTFINSDDEYGESVARIGELVAARGLADRVHVLGYGEQFVLENAR